MNEEQGVKFLDIPLKREDPKTKRMLCLVGFCLTTLIDIFQYVLISQRTLISLSGFLQDQSE